MSDHAPTLMHMAIMENLKTEWQWRLNSQLVNDPMILEEIKKELIDFLREMIQRVVTQWFCGKPIKRILEVSLFN